MGEQDEIAALLVAMPKPSRDLFIALARHQKEAGLGPVEMAEALGDMVLVYAEILKLSADGG